MELWFSELHTENVKAVGQGQTNSCFGAQSELSADRCV